MIYTLTLNPSLDYLVEMEKLMPGKINCLLYTSDAADD